MPQYSLNQTQKSQIIELTQAYINQANNCLGLNLPAIEVKLDLKGRACGMFVVKLSEVCIRYNEIIFSAFYEDNINNTIAHEVAHYVVYSKYGHKKAKPHGKEWKSIMTLFNVKPQVTSKYDVSHLPLHKQTQHDYVCGCMTHQLSTTRHNKVQKHKAVYNCRKCALPLRWHNLNHKAIS